MKKLLMFAAIFAVSGAVFLSAVPDCPTNSGFETIYLPNPDDCSTFYECVYGAAVLRECPEDLVYCPELETCSWMWDKNCSPCGQGGTGGGGSGEGGWGGDIIEKLWPCYNGGRGATGCSIDAGIDISGYGVSAACSVTCGYGYYACCGVRCVCRSN